MLIDTHQHVFWWGRDDAGLVADMDLHGIDLAWLLTWEIPPEQDNASYHPLLNPVHFRADGTHAGIPLSDLLRTRDRYPSRFVVGYCPDPLSGSAARLFEAAYQMYGVRVCGEWKFRMLFDDPRCIELFRVAGDLRCPVVLHLDVPYLVNKDGKMEYQTAWYGGTVDNLERALAACPKTIFIGHAPGFWREISGGADKDPGGYPSGPIKPGGKLGPLFKKYPNLYADLSAGSALNALRRDREHARRFLTRHADRLLFARDYYGGDLHEFLESLKLKKQTMAKIYFENAQRLLSDKPASMPLGVHKL
jgi:predicted TIM-barrel fold metal-dependent hydrolase